MIALVALLIACASGVIGYAILGYFEDRVVARQRYALAIGLPAAHENIGLDKNKILAKLGDDEKERERNGADLSVLLIKAGLDYSARQARLAFLVSGIMVGGLVYLFLKSLGLALLIVPFVAFVVPRIVLAILIARRENAFLDELPNAMEMISRGLRAGMTLAACMKQIAETTAEPLRSEFAYTVDLQKVGMPLGEAIKKMPDRIDLMELRFFAITVEIQQKSGGNLAEILENISSVVRGRKELRAKVKALIAEAKVSSIIICATPVLFSLMSYYTDPDAFSVFWTHPIGLLLTGSSIFLYFVGIGIFIKLTSVRL